MNTRLQYEIDARLQAGSRQMMIAGMEETIWALGYRFERTLDCRSIARWVTGARVGSTYPSCHLYVVQLDDGMSAYNVGARRDHNYRALQALRGEIFSVRGRYLYEF